MFGPHNPHRGMGPVGGNSRLTELLDQIRGEFETQARNSSDYEQQCKFPSRSMFASHDAPAPSRRLLDVSYSDQGRVDVPICIPQVTASDGSLHEADRRSWHEEDR